MYYFYGDGMKKENTQKCVKLRHRDENEKKKIIKRLNMLEGQMRGIKQMIKEDRYCDDILIQLSSAINALKSLENFILENHMNNCMIEEIKNGNNEIVDEIMKLIKKMK